MNENGSSLLTMSYHDEQNDLIQRQSLGNNNMSLVFLEEKKFVQLTG